MKIEGERRTRPDDRSLIRRGGRSRCRSRSATRPRRLLSLASFATILGGLALASASAVAAQLALPGPLEGPGHPELKRRDAKRLAKAVAKLEAGDLEAASAAAAKAGSNPAR